MKIQTNFASHKLKQILNSSIVKKCEATFNQFLEEKCPTLDKITKNALLDIILISDTEIRSINLTSRKLDKTTDVLSWKMYEDAISENMLFGEIYVSDDYIIKQANKKGVEIEQEVILMITHGFLHICGYTHDNDEDENRMNKATLNIMSEIGVDYSIDLI